MTGDRVSVRELSLTTAAYVLFFIAFFADTMFDRVLGFGDGPGYFEPFYNRTRALWTDSLFAGYPVSGDPQSGFFNPVAGLLRLVGGRFDAFVVAGYVLCGVAGVLFGRALTGSRSAGVVAGMAVSCSAFAVGQLDHVAVVHTLAWTVFALAAVELCCIEMTWARCAGLSVSLAMMVLSGSLQFSVYGAAVVFGRVILALVQHPDRLRFSRRLTFAVLIGALGSLVALSPALELVGLSMRSELTWENFTSNSYRLGLLPSFVFPAYFIGREALPGLPDAEMSGFVGLLVLLLSITGAVAGPRPRTLFWLVVVMLTLLASLGPSTPLARVFFAIPGWNLFRGPSRHLFECTIALAALAAFGVDAVVRSLTAREKRLLGASVGGLMVCGTLLLFVWTPRLVPGAPLTPMDWRFLVPICAVSIAVVVVSRLSGRSAATALVIGTIGESLAFHQLEGWRGATPLEPSATPQAITIINQHRRPFQRIVTLRGYWDPDVPANAALVAGIGSASGYSPLEPRAFAEATGIDPNGVALDHLRLLSDDSSLLDVLAVGLVVAPLETSLPAPRFQLLSELGSGRLFRNQRVKERAWFVREALPLGREETERAFVEALLPDGRSFDPVRTAIVERHPARVYEGECTVRGIELEEGSFRATVTCSGQGFLVVSERGFPGWQATIDGGRVPLLRADLLLSGLEVPTGDHVVELRYRPSSVLLGALSGGGALLLLALGFVQRRSWFTQLGA